MKKYIATILLIIICYTGFGQWPITQNLGSGNTLVQVPANGGLRANLINRSYADTTSANLGYSDSYPGSLIFTTDIQAMWLRNAAADGWIQIMPSGGTGGSRPWLIGGQGGLFTSPVDAQIIGVTTNQPFGFMTNNVNRVIVPAAGLSLLTLQSDTTLNKPMTYNTSTKEWNYGYWFGGGGGGSTPISSLTAAAANNTIDNLAYTQTWQWNSLIDGFGLNLLSSSADGTGAGQSVLRVRNSGANTNNGVTSAAATILNNKTGTTSTNIGLDVTASGGTNNYALKLVDGTEGSGKVLTSDASGYASWATPSSTIPTWQQTLTAGSTLTGNNTVDVNNTNLIFDYINGGYFLHQSDDYGQVIMGFGHTDSAFNSLQIQVDGHLEWQNGDGDQIGLEYIGNSMLTLGGNNGTRLNMLSGGTDSSQITFSTSADYTPDSVKASIFFDFGNNNLWLNTYAGQLLIDTLTNNTAQNTIMGWVETAGGDRGEVGYITVGSGLSLAAGVLTATGSGTAWNAITNPTADQALTFDAGESSTWTDANTTEDLFTVNSSTGTTNSLVSLNRTGTALASGNNILELVSSGANGTNAITVTGLSVSVANTNATSGTNIGAAFTASGATTANYSAQFTGAIVPGANDGSAIGTTTRQWSDLFLAEGGVINWDNGDATLTQVGNSVTLDGADLALTGTGAAGATTMSITNNVNGVAGFSVTNTSTGTAAQIQNRLTNNAGDLAYYGVSGSNYSGYAPLNSGKAFFGGYQKAVSIFTQTAHGIEFYPNAVERVRISAAGNILLAGTADPTSAIGTLGIFNGTAPTASIANGTILYSEDVAASSELKVRDEAGNITVLSPHNFSQLGKPSEDLAWSYYSEKDGKYITVDMAKAIRTIEDLSARVEKLEKELGIKSTPPVKLLYKGKVKKK